MKGKRFLILLSLFAVLSSALQASTGYYYKRLFLQQGISSRIYSIFMDKNDFVWAGTKNGLVKVNDLKITNYVHNDSKPLSIPYGSVMRICADSRSRMWVLTTEGVACYRPGTDDFLPLRYKGEIFTASDMCVMPGFLVFINEDGIYKYSLADSTLRKVCRPLKPYSPRAKFAKYDDHTLIYYCGRPGAVIVDCRTWKTRRAPFQNGIKLETLFVDSKKRIWLTPDNVAKGVYCYNINGYLYHLYEGRKTSPGGNVILCMAERNGEILMGTDGSGIYKVNPETHQIDCALHVSGDNFYSLPTNTVYAIYVDHANNIWVGTMRNGLLNVRTVNMRTFYEVPFGNSHGLSDNTALCFYQENPDKIWVGTDGGGVNLYTPSTNSFRHFQSTAEEKVVSISTLRPGFLLLQVYGMGCFVFNTSTGEQTPLVIPAIRENAQVIAKLHSAEVHDLCPDKVLILGIGSYACSYSLSARKATEIKWPKGMMHSGRLYLSENDGKTAYLHDLNTLYRLDVHSSILRPICRLKGGGVQITSATHGAHGNFWIGTNRGLFKYFLSTKKLMRIRTHLFQGVNSLVNDNQNRLWIATDDKVFLWLKKEQKFITFGEMDGVLSNHYLYRSSFLSSDGDVYFGGSRGMVHINNEIRIQKVRHIQLILTDLTVNGSIVPGLITEKNPHLKARWDSNISLDVMSIEHNLFRQKAYRFFIKGLSDDYTETFNPNLVLRSLPSGHYRILVSVMQKDGTWVPWQQVLDLTIMRPWYFNPWFMAVVIAFIAFFFFYFYFLAVSRREAAMRWKVNAHERQVNSDKMRFLIDITHELRTPLTLIYAPLERLMKTLPPTNTYYDSLKRLERQTIRMKHLINMVLDVYKMETSETRLHIKPHKLNEWLKPVVEDFASEGRAQNITTIYEFDSRIGLLSFDKDKCDMVINNLLGNAMKHSSAGGHIYVRTKLNDDGTKVRISVSDEGPGLKGVDPDQLFRRFYQGDNETVGSGIGLSYSKILVEQHGGTIGAFDNERVGATFFFELPAGSVEEEVLNQPHPYLSEMLTGYSEEETAPSHENYDLSRYKILVVDDNKALTDFLQDALKNSFSSVYVASDGVGAMKAIKENMPDVVVSDVMMPRKDGFELCKEIKENVTISHIVVILLTARDDSRSLSLGYKNGADGYLTKPFEVDTLLGIISSRLHDREIARNRYLSAGLLPVVSDTTFSSADEAFMVHLDKVISDNIERSDIDVPEICEKLGMSRSTLYKKLKAITDMGANEYVMKFRMETAVKLIETTSMPLGEVAERVGISSPRYFSTTFKHYIGESPSMFRKKSISSENAADER
jgi:signal transduction histidine kinase/ligand-binding sensor domain-containing protein/DNA-binding NarL/FixJ family response regulator